MDLRIRIDLLFHMIGFKILNMWGTALNLDEFVNFPPGEPIQKYTMGNRVKHEGSDVLNFNSENVPFSFIGGR